MAPLAHAVRLVDGEQRDLDRAQQLEGRGHHEPLGGDVQKLEATGPQVAQDRRGLICREGRVQELGGDAVGVQGVDLVFHERNQRRDDDRGAGAMQRRDLEAERLAAPRGHEDERVAAGDEVLDDLALVRAERVVAEDAAERVVDGSGDGIRLLGVVASTV